MPLLQFFGIFKSNVFIKFYSELVARLNNVVICITNMKLIFLHGPPASGKYTIAVQLGAQLGCGIFHNHLTIDVARPLFEFGTTEFWSFVQQLRINCFRATAEGDRTVIYTSCYDHPNDLQFFEEIEKIVEAADGKVIPVYLSCGIQELEKRVLGESRKDMGKVRSVEGLHRQFAKWNCIAVPRDNCITVSTEGKTAEETAGEILVRIKGR